MFILQIVSSAVNKCTIEWIGQEYFYTVFFYEKVEQ